MRRLVPSLGIAALILTACSSADEPAQRVSTRTTPSTSATTTAGASATPTAQRGSRRGLLPGMPPPLSPHDIYAADRPGLLSPAVRHDPALVYVPNSESDTLDVIDQRTFQIVGHYSVGALPQHVTPSYDMRTLYVLNDRGNSLTVINPRTGKPGRTIPVTDPYNMYFTPDGRYAIVVAEALQRLDFRDARTMKLVHTVNVDCRGIDHADFTANGRYAIFSCEFSGKLLKLDVAHQRVVGTISVTHWHAHRAVPTTALGT